MENQYLAHYGILGQKWGIRRYQNKDGSLTSAGKKHQRRVIGENNDGTDKYYEKKSYANKDELKSEKKSNYKKVTNSTSLFEKLVFNTATRKRAAKYMTEYGASMNDAKFQARTDAIKNTGKIFVASTLVGVGSVIVKNIVK